MPDQTPNQMPSKQTHEHLLRLIDHPPQDAEAPRNPVLTHQVMERVRLSHAQAHAGAQHEHHDTRLWVLGAVLVLVLALLAPTADVFGDGGLREVANLFDPELLVELVVGAVIAAGALALTWRKMV